MTDVSNLRSLRQLAEELKPTGGFSESMLRFLIHPSRRNGLADCVVRVGRRVYVDRARFNDWIESRRQAGAGSSL